MQCPACKDVTLVMTERQGVEIDYCPTCRGIWLDRGELDKIIERSSLLEHGGDNFQTGKRSSTESEHRRDYRGSRDYRKKKKKSFLSELFEFD